MSFLKDYWLWIAIPFVVVTGGLLALMLMGDGDAISPFIYPL